MSRWFEGYGFADVADALVIGAYPLDADDVERLTQLGIVRVLNLVSDVEYPPGSRTAVARALAVAGIVEHRLTFTDFGHLPAAEIEVAATMVARWLRAGDRTYLHCRAGWQRSAAIAAGAVAIADEVDIDTALMGVQRRKPSANPLPHQREELYRWWADRGPAAT